MDNINETALLIVNIEFFDEYIIYYMIVKLIDLKNH